MKAYRIVLAALACAVLLPLAAEAQVTYRITHRGVLGIVTEATMTPGAPVTQRVIVDVVPGSPAERAGVQRGDTLLSINRSAATDEVMGAPFAPGDTVVLRVRRAGREQEFTVVAAERTQQFQTFTVNALPDSVRRQIAEIMDAVRLQADTLHLRSLRIERLRGDSTVVFHFGDDSSRVFRMRPLLEAEFNVDSLRARGLRLDSLRHFMHPDSARGRFRFDLRDGRVFVDSVPGARFEGNVLILPQGDTMHVMRPAEIFASGFSMGMRAVAGAELAELNPGLAEYFGGASGVLVVNAPEGTPAARAGMRAGDVIVEIGGTRVSSIAEVRRALGGTAAPGAALPVRVLRHGRQVDLTLTR